MYIQKYFFKSKKRNKALIYLVGILFGIISGASNSTPLHNLGLLISDLFIKTFKCISLPVIALSIIVTLSGYNSSDKQMRQIWQRTLFYTISTTLIAAGLACGLYLAIAPPNISTLTCEPITIPNATHQEGYLAYLIQIIPNNIFAPFVEHQIMGALFISTAVGIAIRYIPDDTSRHVMTGFFKGAHSIFIVITSWVVRIIPLAFFGFIITAIVQLKNGVDIRGLGGYLMIIVLANLMQGGIVLPVFLYLNKVHPISTLYGMLPTLAVAFFSKSSVGTLPVTIEAAERNLGITPKVSQFVLPLCTSINMNGCAAFIFTTVIYLMQNNGIKISIITMLIWVLIATIAAIGNAGVPMGCFFLSASLLTSMNVPIALLGLILPFYGIIDMIETSLNVWSDVCVAKVVDMQIKKSQ